jgi:hypothetical protein
VKFFHAFSTCYILSLFLMIQSCKQTEFTGRGGAEREPASATPTPTLSYSPVPTLLPSSTPVPTPTMPIVTAVECNATTIRWARETSQCPAGYAAFALDDAKETSIACCPLPAADIFAADLPVVRTSTCAAGEVAVGGSANGGLLCQKINLGRYALAPMRPTCYYGSGAAGGSGSQACSAPPVTLQAMATKFGSDACLPVPYGALITSHNKNGKCADANASVLFFRDTGMVVPMFK